MNSNQTILAIVGMPGAGKSAAAEYFSKKSYPVIRFGAVTDEGLKQKGLAINPENEKAFREKLRQELGMAAYAIKIESQINEALSRSRLVILDGLYSWEEFAYLKDKFAGLKLLAVYAMPAVRFKRLRQRKIRPLSQVQAQERDVAEIVNLNKGGPIAMADFLVTNNTDEASLFKQLDQVLVAVND
ncbi:MAG TPA: AAA family ATPase [Patescibacteria group bacterium]|nr:AAA family ATPase [Patescibacteria group bacterium]